MRLGEPGIKWENGRLYLVRYGVTRFIINGKSSYSADISFKKSCEGGNKPSGDNTSNWC